MIMFKQISTILFLVFVLLASGLIAVTGDVNAVVFVVNSTGDNADLAPADGQCDTGAMIDGAPECTLRAAIQEANEPSVPDTITFNIPATDPGFSAAPLSYTIKPLSALPIIMDAVELNANTQPGFTTNPVIQLDGSMAGAVDGLVLRANGSTIRGLIVHSFTGVGIEIDGSNGSGNNNVIINNWVGIDASLSVNGNGEDGISIVSGAGSNFIEENVVGGNLFSGIVLQGLGTEENTFTANFVGVAPDGITDIGNGQHGIWLRNQTANNLIGGTLAGQSNIIAFNTKGIVLSGDSGTSNSILGNFIFSNASLGIDLGDDNVTANDVGDIDAGPNDLLNHPVLTSVTPGNIVTIEGTLSSDPSTQYQIEFFSNTACDGSGFGEGETFLGFAPVTTDGSGNSVFTLENVEIQAGHQYITATATQDLGGAFGSTSEFSMCLAIDSDGDGTPDEQDICPFDPDDDIDNDGVCGDEDGCPNDPAKTDPGECGCGIADADADGDGIADCNDNCPNDPDNDVDQDTVCGDIDNCVDIPNPGQEDADNNGIGDACESNGCDCSAPNAIHGIPFRFFNKTFIFGTKGPDTICGTDGRDIVFALGGDDCIDTGEGKDRVFAGSGNDIVKLGPGNDKAWGGFGDDEIDGEDGFDRVNGGRGFDTCLGESLRRCEN